MDWETCSYNLYQSLSILLPRNYTSARAECVGQWKIQKLRPTHGTRTRDLIIARPTLYLTTTDTTMFYPKVVSLGLV